MAWSTLLSAVLHLIILTLLFYLVARQFVPRGAKESISQTTIVTVARRAAPTPAPRRMVRRVRQRESAPSRAVRRELAKVVTVRASPEPAHATLPSIITRDQAGFAKEVAQLNRQDDPHAIPTIDPGSRESPTKTYSFAVPSSLRGDDHGNGIITPTQHWRDKGADCYYGRYEFTYPDGAMEYGTIVWPFCYDPASDPFKEPPHTIPFPLPLAGFKLPPGAQMPPIERSVYEQWAATSGLGPSAP